MPDDRFLHRRAGHSEKVNALSDLEYRVWTQYLLSADDYGVMRYSAITIQADNDSLANRPAKLITRCLDALTKPGGLLRTFDHQNRIYAYQHDWQSWQKVTYPRSTNNPKPPDDALANCDDATRELFVTHPGGAGRKRKERSENGSGTVPETVTEHSPLTRERAPAKRLTANGLRLAANGSEGGPGEPDAPMDVWARELVDLYPVEGRCGWNLVERPLFAALKSIAADQAMTDTQAWEWLKVRVEQHKHGHQWRDKRMVKRLDRWLADGLYLSEPVAHAPSAGTDDKVPTWAR